MMDKNKRCYSSSDFQYYVNKKMQEIGRLQDEIDAHNREMDSKRKEILELKQSLKTIALKGDCEKCEHKLECITTNKENINVKPIEGW